MKIEYTAPEFECVDIKSLNLLNTTEETTDPGFEWWESGPTIDGGADGDGGDDF